MTDVSTTWAVVILRVHQQQSSKRLCSSGRSRHTPGFKPFTNSNKVIEANAQGHPFIEQRGYDTFDADSLAGTDTKLINKYVDQRSNRAINFAKTYNDKTLVDAKTYADSKSAGIGGNLDMKNNEIKNVKKVLARVGDNLEICNSIKLVRQEKEHL